MKTFWLIDDLNKPEEQLLYDQGFSAAIVIDPNYDYAFCAIVTDTEEQEFLLRLRFGQRLQLYSPQLNDSII